MKKSKENRFQCKKKRSFRIPKISANAFFGEEKKSGKSGRKKKKVKEENEAEFIRK